LSNRSRSELILTPFTRDMKLIEVGPSYNPVAPKAEGWDTYIIDHASQDELQAKYQTQDAARIEPVDAIWTGGLIDTAIPADLHGTFDGLIASHTLEHMPDLVGFLQSVATVLKPSACISLALPDLRVCFDFFQPHSTTGDLLDAHVQGRARHRKGRVFDEHAYLAKRGDSIVWMHGDDASRELYLAYDLHFAFHLFNTASEDAAAIYTDCHAWTFTPSSFALAMLELRALNQIPYDVTAIQEADGAEFYATLALDAEPLTAAQIETRRFELLRQIVFEREEQITQLRTETMPRTTLASIERNIEPVRTKLTIAAIIPLYNGARYIETALLSILAQTHAPDEIYVVNDGSTDDGPALVAQMAVQHPQITLLNMAAPGQNQGQSAARNFGIAASSTDLIALLDQDDRWYPNHLATLLAKFTESDEIDQIGWVYSNLDEVDVELNMVWRDFLSSLTAPHPKTNLLACLGGDMFVLPSSSLISRAAFDEVGGFDERLSGYEDDDLFLRLFQAGYRNYYIKESLTQWRIHTTSTSYSSRMANSRRIYMQKLFEKFPNDRERQRFYRRDVLVPRFLTQTLSEYRKAVETNDATLIQSRWQDAYYVTSYMDGYKAFMMRNLLRGIKSPAMARRYYAIRRVAGMLRRLTRLFK